MKIKTLAGIFAGLGVIIGSAVFNPAEAQTKNTNTYYCAQLNNSWNTFVNTPRGRVKLINWENEFSPDWTPPFLLFWQKASAVPASPLPLRLPCGPVQAVASNSLHPLKEA